MSALASPRQPSRRRRHAFTAASPSCTCCARSGRSCGRCARRAGRCWPSFVAMAGLGAAGRCRADGRWSSPAARTIGSTYDSINTAVGGYHLAQLAIGVLGVLVITGEYSTGMIRSSLMAVPRRLPVLWAKLLVFAAVTFVLMLVVVAHLVLRRSRRSSPSTTSSTALGDPARCGR